MEAVIMKKIVSAIAIAAFLCAASAEAVVIYQNDYNSETPGGGVPGSWNWTNGAVTTHTAVYADIGQNMVVRHTGIVNNSGTAAQNSRYGSKWNITVSGNTSADPADYTIELDLRNVSGNWNPIPLEVWVLTLNPAAGTGTYGHGFPTANLTQADGWVHLKFNLGEYTKNWWEGTNWDLTNSTWSLEIGMPYPGQSVAVGQSWTQVWEMDNLKITMGADTLPYEPSVTPVNADGTVGKPVNNNAQVEVTLHFKAGGDPSVETSFPVNPAILGHYIYLSNGNPNDPNVALLDYVLQVHNPDPNLTSPDVSYGPITLTKDTTYYWQVEEAINDGTGNPYPAGDPNNLLGPLWSFVTTAGSAMIDAVSPELTVVGAGTNAVLTVSGSNIETYQWYKIGSPDVLLTNGSKYAGADTAVLTIKDVQLADEGYYYCIGSNGIPTQASNRQTGPGRVMIKRLVNYYPMDEIIGNLTPDVVGDADMTLLTNGTLLPSLSSEKAVGSGSLSLDPAAEPTGQYGRLPAGVLDYMDFTITAWVNWKGNSNGNWQRIFDFGNDTNQYVFLTPVGWNGVTRFVIKDGTEQIAGIDGNLPTNQWVHVAVTLSGDTGRLYINGTLVATNTGMTFNPISFKPVLNYIGRSMWTGDAYFNGLIDDFKIYNYGLSVNEVAQEYLAVVGGYVCNMEIYDMQNYDVNRDCKIDITDFASFAARWLEEQRIYPE